MTPDDIRIKIGKLIKDRRLSLSKVSEGIGKNVAYLHQYLKKGSPLRLPEQQRRKLSRILNVPEQELTDLEINTSSTSTDIDEVFLARIIKNISSWEEENGEYYSPEDKAKLIKLIYQKLDMSAAKDMDKEISNVINIYNFMKTAN